MNGKKFFGMALLAAGLVGTAHRATASDLWLHIDVNGKGDKGEQANINLPLSMVRNMAPMLEEKSHGSNASTSGTRIYPSTSCAGRGARSRTGSDIAKAGSPVTLARLPSPSMARATVRRVSGSRVPSRPADSTSAIPSARASSQPSSKACSGSLRR